MKLEWSSPALRELSHLSKPVKKRIVDKMEWFLSQDDPLSFAKPLQGAQFGSHRFRIGDYRVLVDVDHSIVQVMLVLAVRNRKEAYRL